MSYIYVMRIEDEDFAIETNKSKEDIIKAYNKIGIPFRIKDRKMDERTANLLGLDDLWVDDLYDIPSLFMDFIKISLPDLEYKELPDEKVFLFGWDFPVGIR